eukprot:3495307-Pyramimonas_sp.AAC.1
MARYHDATNAFYCVKKHYLVAVAMDLAKDDKTHFLEQRTMNNTFLVQDGALGAHLQSHEGALPGDHASTKIFCAGLLSWSSAGHQQYGEGQVAYPVESCFDADWAGA